MYSGSRNICSLETLLPSYSETLTRCKCDSFSVKDSYFCQFHLTYFVLTSFSCHQNKQSLDLLSDRKSRFRFKIYHWFFFVDFPDFFDRRQIREFFLFKSSFASDQKLRLRRTEKNKQTKNESYKF